MSDGLASHEETVRCPNCGAPLPDFDDETPCPFCGALARSVPAGGAESLAPLLDVLDRPYDSSDAIGGGRLSRVALLLVPIAVGVVAVGGLAWWFGSAAKDELGITSWEPDAGPVVPVRIGGHDAFIGLEERKRSQDDDHVYLVAVDADDASVLWSAGPFDDSATGSADDEDRSSIFAVSGHAVALIAPDALHVLGIATGRALRTVNTRMAVRTCPYDDGQSVWLETDSLGSFRLDLGTGKVTPVQAAPPSCESSSLDDHDQVPAVDGFEVGHVRSAGGIAVVLGSKGAGSAAMAFDTRTHRVLWQAPISGAGHGRQPWRSSFDTDNIDALTASRYVTAYRVRLHRKDVVRLTAFDVHSGKRLWDRGLPAGHIGVSDVVVTPDHVVVELPHAVDILRLRDGHLVGTIGH